MYIQKKGLHKKAQKTNNQQLAGFTDIFYTIHNKKTGERDRERE